MRFVDSRSDQEALGKATEVMVSSEAKGAGKLRWVTSPIITIQFTEKATKSSLECSCACLATILAWMKANSR